MRLGRITWIHERHQNRAQLFEVHWLRHVAIKPGFDTLLVHVAEDIRRERDYRQMGVLVLFLPFSDFLAGLVAVFVGHVEITQYDRVVTIWLGEDLLCALDAIKHRVNLDVHLCEKFEDNLDKTVRLYYVTMRKRTHHLVDSIILDE